MMSKKLARSIVVEEKLFVLGDIFVRVKGNDVISIRKLDISCKIIETLVSVINKARFIPHEPRINRTAFTASKVIEILGKTDWLPDSLYLWLNNLACIGADELLIGYVFASE